MKKSEEVLISLLGRNGSLPNILKAIKKMPNEYRSEIAPLVRQIQISAMKGVGEMREEEAYSID